MSEVVASRATTVTAERPVRGLARARVEHVRIADTAELHALLRVPDVETPPLASVTERDRRCDALERRDGDAPAALPGGGVAEGDIAARPRRSHGGYPASRSASKRAIRRVALCDAAEIEAHAVPAQA